VPGVGARRHLRWPAAVGFAVCLLLPSATSTPVSAAASRVKTTSFTGAIVAGTGRYANLRGAVDLRLAGAPTEVGPSAGHGFTFTIALSGPPCAGRPARPPRRCVSLAGSVRGSVGVTAPRIPDVGRLFLLKSRGRVAPLGEVLASGTTSAIGFIAHGRFPLRLQLMTAAGSITIRALGPLMPGFSSPF